MLNLSVNLHEKRENIIFVNKRKLFLKCKIQPRLYDFQKAYFENYYDHTKAKFLLKYHSITRDYLYFEFPFNSALHLTFCNEYNFITKICKLSNLIFNKQMKELDLKHPFILQAKQLYDEKQLIKDNSILKYLEEYTKSPENKKFYTNVITELSVDNLMYNKYSNQYFFIDYNAYGITDDEMQQVSFDDQIYRV
jgi:hypothetical protein